MPNGIVNIEQLRYVADVVSKYEPSQGVLDITTRMNLQLRGIPLEDASDIINGLYDIGLTSFMRFGCAVPTWPDLIIGCNFAR